MPIVMAVFTFFAVWSVLAFASAVPAGRLCVVRTGR
jgi:hypothetical protein